LTEEDLSAWFSANRTLLETAYLAAEQPWQQSGFGLHTPRTYEAWEAHRKPIADCVERSGTFLDVGCANGFLLECVVRWTAERGIAVQLYGLDLSEKLVALARARLPAAADHLFVGNGWDWAPPRTFDYVATALEYVPNALQAAYVSRLLREFVNPGGRLIVVGYRGRGEEERYLFVDQRLTHLGFAPKDVKSGWWEGEEKTRVAILEGDVISRTTQ
jgi:SAM-dependent methyltransferase